MSSKTHPEVGLQRAAPVVAEFSDVEMILVDNVDMASNLMRMGLEEMIDAEYHHQWLIILTLMSPM